MLDDETATIHPDDAAAFSQAVHPLIVGVADRTLVTYRAQHKHGHWIWIEETISLVRDQATQRPASLVCSLRDISERHRHADELKRVNATLEQLASHLVAARDVAERASQAKSRFLEGMSHELRTPLNGLLGYAQLLGNEGGLNVAQTARVDAMLRAGSHLMEMMHCVLDLSEIETEHFELQITDVDLRRLVGACVELARPAAEAKGLDLRLRVAPSVPQNIKADPTRLRQVLLNLLGNAVKLTAQGVVDMRVLTTAGGAELRIETVDTGSGLPPEQSQRPFQEIDRLDTDAIRSVEGGELGLQISARLAGLMGGRVGHDNSVGGGVTWLALPLASRALAGPGLAAAAGPDRLDAGPVQAPRRVLRVLVVDDVLMNRDIASSFLRMAGHEVTCVDGGAEAVAAVASTDFDVVLMDVRMPEMDGLEATRRIRALEGKRARVPIVALTAQAFSSQVAECQKAGMDSHLPKPFDRDMLLAAVVRAGMAGSPPNRDIASIPEGIAVIAAPATPVIGLDLPVLNLATFERTAVFLAPDVIGTHLRTITKLSEALLHDLHEPDALARTGEQLAEAAHTLAGSAGMFSFERLSTLARRFEPAVQSGSIEAASLGASLSAALEATLEELQARTAAIAAA
jgi:signal transduction histidine kinase/ActR/RegA family two-component response regulator/HPt (histidine-containing phosphotransfer) domain-containing protein